MAAYRNGKKFKDEMRGRTFDYSQKCQEHRIHSEILAPEHAPEWMTESGTLWNGVQQFETNLILKRYSGTQKDPEARAKSLLGRKKALASNQDAASFIVDLPKELTAEQNIEFLRSYLQDRFVSQGLVVDYSIHAASGNWHAHFAVTLRPLIESGEFSLKKMTSYRYEQKHKDVFNRENLIESRKQYAVHMNAAFRRYGITKRVSHKSFKDQGIFREATKHEGPFARLLDGDQSKPVSRMGRENQAIKDRNLALYRENPRYFVHDFAHSCTEFTLADVAKEVHKLVNGDEALFQDLYGKVRDNVMAVDIPESAKQVDVLTHKGTSKSVVVYDSDAVIEHLSQVIAAEKSPQNSLDINHSRSNQNQLDQSFTSQDKAQDKTLVSLLLSQKQRDVKNHSSQKNLSGHDCARMVMQDILVNPSLVGDALAKQRIVFRDHDVDAVMTILMNTMGEKSHDSSSDSLTSQEQLQSLKAAYEKAVFDQQPENPSNKTVSKGIKNLWKSFTKSDDNREELSGEPSQPLASSLVSSLPTYDFTDQEAFLTSVSKAVVNHEACVLLREDTRRVHVDDAEHTINSLDKNPRETNRFELVDSRLYTSQTQQDSEQTTLARAKRLSALDRDCKDEGQNQFAVIENVLTKILSTTEDAQGFAYLPEQKEAIHTLLSAGRLKILKGRAGTGKTTILNPVVKTLQAEGYDVKGMAFQGVVADSLANDLDIHSKNIDQYSHAWRAYDDAFQKKINLTESHITRGGKKYKSPLRIRYEKICEAYQNDVLTSKSVVIIDEGSMISHGHYELVLSRIEAAGAKCILVKDDAQMKAIQGADIALALDQSCDQNEDMATLHHVVRQKEDWMQNASKAFNDHDVLSGLYEYAERDAIHFGETRDQALDHMVQQFCESYEYQRQSEGYQDPSIVALAYTNGDIKALNQGIFKDLQERGLLPKETFTLNQNTFAIGARVMFTDNDNTERHVKTVFDPSSSKSTGQHRRKKGVKNGKMGTLHAYNPETGLVHVKLDDGRVVEFSSPDHGAPYNGKKSGSSKPSQKCPITLAYALSTMKSQGKTFDEALVYLGAYDSANTTLVGCTRHKRYLQIITSQDISPYKAVTSFRDLSRVISRDTNRFVSTDYSISESDHPYFEKIQAYREAVIDRASLLHRLQEHHKSYRDLHGDLSQWTPEIKERFDAQKENLNATRYVVDTAQKTTAEDLFLNWDRCAVLAKQCGLKKDVIAKHAGHHQELFTHRERQRLDTIASYFDVCQKIGEVREAMGMDMPLSLQESHESYGLYEELIQHRTQVAYEITRSPHAYEPLMKTKAIYGEDSQPLYYELADGKRYTKKPPSYRTCEAHARYLDPPSLVFDISNPEQRERAKHQSELFDAVLAYQKANRRYGMSYYELKSNPQCLENPDVKELFETQRDLDQKTRDQKAYEVFEKLGQLSYEESIGILDYCQLRERDMSSMERSHAQVTARQTVRTFLDEDDFWQKSQQAHDILQRLEDAKAAKSDNISANNSNELYLRPDVIYALKDELRQNNLYENGVVLQLCDLAHKTIREELDNEDIINTIQIANDQNDKQISGLDPEPSSPDHKTSEEKKAHIKDEIGKSLHNYIEAYGKQQALQKAVKTHAHNRLKDNLDQDKHSDMLVGVCSEHGFVTDHLPKPDYEESLRTLAKVFQDLEPDQDGLPPLGYHGDQLVRQTLALASDHDISHQHLREAWEMVQDDVSEDQETTVKTHQDQTKNKALSVFDPILPELMTAIETLNHDQQWGLSEDQMVCFQDAVLRAALDKPVFDKEMQRLRTVVLKDVYQAEGYHEIGKDGQYQTYGNKILEASELKKRMGFALCDGPFGHYIESLTESIKDSMSESIDESLDHYGAESSVSNLDSGFDDEPHSESFVESSREPLPQDVLEDSSIDDDDSHTDESVKPPLESWATHLKELYEAQKLAHEKLKDFRRSTGFEKAKQAYDISEIMGTKDDPFGCIRRAFQKSEIFKNSMRMDLFKTLYECYHVPNDELAHDKYTQGQNSQDKNSQDQNPQGQHRPQRPKESFDEAKTILSPYYADYYRKNDLYLELREKAIEKVGPRENDSVRHTLEVLQILINGDRVTSFDLHRIEQRGMNFHQTEVKESSKKKDIKNKTQESSAKTATDQEKLAEDDLSKKYKTFLSHKTIKEIQKEITDLSKKRDLGLTAHGIDQLMPYFVTMVEDKYEYESKVQDTCFETIEVDDGNGNISYEYVFPEVEMFFEACKELAKSKAEVLKLSSLPQLMSRRGRWSLDLKESYLIQEKKKEEEKNKKKAQKKTLAKNQKKAEGTTKAYNHLDRSKKPFSSFDRQDINRLAEKVNAAIDAETLAKDILRARGFNPKKSNKRQLRFGKQGSFLVTCDGSHANTWHDFETGEGGDLLNLIQREQRLDFKESLAYAANYCRGGIRSEIDKFLDGHNINKSVVDSLPEKTADHNRDQSDFKQKQQKIADVKALVQKSVPITNTPAETYLRRERHIQGVLPESLRYVPAGTQYTYEGKSKYIKEGALISLAKSPNNETQAAQITYLTADGKRAKNKDGNKFTKITYGSAKGAYVTLQQGDKDQPFIMAEGVETALSVKESGVKGTVVCSLGIGNYKNIIKDQKDVVIAADWDGSTEMPTYKASEKAKQQVEEQGGKAHIIFPVSSTEETTEENKDKTDFNDVLQTKGVASVKDLVKKQCHHIQNEYEHSHETILKEAHDHGQIDIKSDRQKDNEREQHALTAPQPNSGSQFRTNDITNNIVSGNQSQTASSQPNHPTKAEEKLHDTILPLEKTPKQELTETKDTSQGATSEPKKHIDDMTPEERSKFVFGKSKTKAGENQTKMLSDMTPEERSAILLGGGSKEWAKHNQDKTVTDMTAKENYKHSPDKSESKGHPETKKPIRTFSDMTPEERSKIIFGGGLKEWGKQYETKPKSKDKNKDRGFGR